MRNFFKMMALAVLSALSCQACALPTWWDLEMARMDRIERGTTELARLRAGGWR